MKLAQLFTAALLLSACGGPLKYEVPSSPRAPGADAKIVADVSKDQGQTQLTVDITNLPPPNRIVEKDKVYVVWYRKDEHAAWARVGGLKYDEGDREGKLTGSVPEVAFDLAVTPEADDSAVSPSPEVIVSQRVEK